MRKIIACIVALMVCMSMVLPVVAAKDTFTPSVTNKPSPRVVPVMDPNGKPAIGVVLSGDQIISYVYEDCLVITAVSEANTSERIPGSSRDLLLEVYAKLLSGEMKLPYSKFNAGLKDENMVIRDLFDATFLCKGADTKTDHPELLEPTGVVLQITFDLDVAADAKVYTMNYKRGEWSPIVSTVNNGDGTVTCTFEDLCPIAFCVEQTESGPVKPPVQTGDPDGDSMKLWVLTAVVSLVAIVALVVVYRVKFTKKSR